MALSSSAGQSGGHSPAWPARQSTARASRVRVTTGLMVSRWLLMGLSGPASASLQHHLYPLGCAPKAGGRGPDHGAGGSWGTLPGLFGGHPPDSAGQTPKDVVVGAWAGPRE